MSEPAKQFTDEWFREAGAAAGRALAAARKRAVEQAGQDAQRVGQMLAKLRRGVEW